MVGYGYSPTDFYKPSREDTKEDIKKLRIIVENQLGAFRPIVILGVTDIVLWILKCDDGFNKRVEIEKLINPITDHRFEQMLLIAQHITDYSDINLCTTDHPSCVDQFHNHDHHIATMECIVAYALLIRLYEYGPRIRRHRCFPPAQIAHRKKAYEMLLILRNESVKPMEAQKNMISRFFRRGMSDYILFDLMVFIIDNLFAEFCSHWYDVIVSVKEAAINHAKSPLYGDEEVMGALFRGGAKFWLPEEPSTAQLSRDGDKVTDKEVIGEGFKDSENELKDSGFSSSSSSSHSLHYHNQQLFLSRKVEVLGKESQEGSHEEGTEKAHQQLLTLVEHRLGEFPSMVIQGIADIVLWILKSNDKFNNPIDKRVEIEKVLDKITDQVFQQMLDIAQSITDFTTTNHPYIYEFHNDQPIKTMQNIVAYNLPFGYSKTVLEVARPPPADSMSKEGLS
ncbi:hypothetical protein Syun_007924 [Stephania yunnanensis]|uniref:Pre-mRNA-splicing helicase BRR2-like plug domain-containing protein n=1 Tax=Stephania yunnanensis TaxID=152371 RepID=A0AAP0L0S7_9MAGN